MPAELPVKPLACDHGRRRDTIVQSLMAEIFRGRMRAGQRLVTQELAERFGVSHTPIREALVALAGIGVIDLAPNRGAVVRSVTKREVREVCHVRRALECEATRNACGRIDRETLEAMADDLRRLAAIRKPTLSRFVRKAREIDSRLHDTIADHCGNAFLAKELNRLKTLFRAFRDVSYEHNEARNDYRRLSGEAGEHLAVVESLLAGKRSDATRAMARHILSGVKYWGRAIPDGETVRSRPDEKRVRIAAIASESGRNGQTETKGQP